MRPQHCVASVAAEGAAAVGRVAIVTSQGVAATAMLGTAVAVVTAGTNLSLTAVAAAAAAEGAAAASASAGVGPPTVLEQSFHPLTQAILLFFSPSRLRLLGQRLPPFRMAGCCPGLRSQ